MSAYKTILNSRENVLHKIIIDPEGIYAVPAPGRNDLNYHYENEKLILDSPKEEFIKAYNDASNYYLFDEEDKNYSDIFEKGSKQKRQYRTRANAGDVADIPAQIALPSQKPYIHALHLTNPEGIYQLTVNISDEIKSRCRNCNSSFTVIDESSVFKDLSNNRIVDVKDIDLTFLAIFYSIDYGVIQKKIEASHEFSEVDILGYGASIYVPDLMKKIHPGSSNPNDKQIAALIKKMRSYEDIYGLYPVKQLPGKVGIAAVMKFNEYDPKCNIIRFSTPYFNRVIYNILDEYGKKNKHKKLCFNMYTGTIQPSKPIHSYLVKASIFSCKNTTAIDIVMIVCVIISRCGGKNHKPHASARFIIGQLPKLQQCLNEISSNTNRDRRLRTAFLKAWELLETHTLLKETYKNIVFPTTAPSMKNLDMVFEFPHEGRINSK